MPKRRPPPLEARIAAIESCESESFRALVKAAGLNPASAFRFAKLQNQSFDDCDLTGYDFTGANLIGSSFVRAFLGDANFRGARVETAALQHAQDWPRQSDRVAADIAATKLDPETVAAPKCEGRVLFLGVPDDTRAAVEAALAGERLELTWVPIEEIGELEPASPLIRAADAIVVFDMHLETKAHPDVPADRQQRLDGDFVASVLAQSCRPGMPIQLYELASSRRYRRALDPDKDFEVVEIPSLTHAPEIVVPGVWRFLAQHFGLEVAETAPPSPIGASRELLFPLHRTPRVDEKSLLYWIDEAHLPSQTGALVRKLIRGHRNMIGRADRSADDFRFHAEALQAQAQALRQTYPVQANSGLGQIVFALKLEAAVCRFQAGESSDAHAALNDLRAMSDVYANRPMLWFRMAQVHAWVKGRGMSDEFPWADDTVEVLHQAHQCLVRLERLSGRQRHLVATVSEIQFLRDHLAGMRARVHLAALPNADDEERLRLLFAAFEALASGIEAGESSTGHKWRHLHDCIVVGSLALREARLQRRRATEAVFTRLYGLVEALAGLARTRRAGDHLAALAFAFQELGQVDEARRAAARFLSLRQASKGGSAQALAQDARVTMALDVLTAWASDDVPDEVGPL